MTLHEQLTQWKALFENPMWGALEEVLKAQIAAREAVILEEKLTPDGLYDREMIRGERAGLKLALVIAETMAEQVKLDYEAEKEQGNVDEKVSPV